MRLQFQEETTPQIKTKGTFLTRLLLKKGLVTDHKRAEMISALLLLSFITIILVVIILQNTEPAITEKYYFDPEVDNAYNDV